MVAREQERNRSGPVSHPSQEAAIQGEDLLGLREQVQSQLGLRTKVIVNKVFIGTRVNPTQKESEC